MNLNPMGLNGPGWGGNVQQPNAPRGSFTPGRQRLLCPTDNIPCVLIGSTVFRWRCVQCGWQFDDSGNPQPSNPIQPGAFVLAPEVPGDEDRIDYSVPPFDQG